MHAHHASAYAALIASIGALTLDSTARVVPPMPVRHALVAVSGEPLAGQHQLEALALTAYGYAMS
jgi:hypothetical protein